MTRAEGYHHYESERIEPRQLSVRETIETKIFPLQDKTTDLRKVLLNPSEEIFHVHYGPTHGGNEPDEIRAQVLAIIETADTPHQLSRETYEEIEAIYQQHFANLGMRGFVRAFAIKDHPVTTVGTTIKPAYRSSWPIETTLASNPMIDLLLRCEMGQETVKKAKVKKGQLAAVGTGFPVNTTRVGDGLYEVDVPVGITRERTIDAFLNLIDGVLTNNYRFLDLPEKDRLLDVCVVADKDQQLLDRMLSAIVEGP